jgi:hypothetical protein
VSINVVPAESDWKERELLVTAPANAKQAAVYVVAHTGVVEVADCSLVLKTTQ